MPEPDGRRGLLTWLWQVPGHPACRLLTVMGLLTSLYSGRFRGLGEFRS